MTKSCLLALVLTTLSGSLAAQVTGRFPPDSLINVKVFPKTTPVADVITAMRTFAGALGVRCQYCHVGEEGKPLREFDFAKDEKRTKLVARQMMRMVEEVNRRIDTLPHDHQHSGPAAAPAPGAPPSALQVTCVTCHRGVSRPVPLEILMLETAGASGADSAVRLYRALRTRYYGRASYDFGEPTLNTAALRLGRAGKFDEALVLLGLNEEQFPNSSVMYVVRGNIGLMRSDTNAAATAFREAIRRDSTNDEARGRLRAIGRQP